MTGRVDDSGRALVRVRLKNPADATELELDTWIDTGFTGELVLSQQSVSSLGLPLGPRVLARLADGSDIQLDTYTCLVEWFDEWKRIEVVANEDNSLCSAWASYWIAICTLIIEPRQYRSLMRAEVLPNQPLDRLTFRDDLGHCPGGVGAEAHLGDVEKRVHDRPDDVAHVDRVVGGLAAVGGRAADDLTHR